MQTAHAVRDGRAAATWRALGTHVRLVVTEGARLDDARRALEADLAEIDKTCSRFRPDSELRTLPRDGRPATLSPLLAEAIGVALRAARLTDGDVDPTIGGALNAAGYDRDFRTIELAGPALRRGVIPREVPGWRNIRLADRTLTMPPGTTLDLGATAKAWAADRSAARIAGDIGTGVLVSLGGDIAVAGPPPANGWNIRVQDIAGDPEDDPEGPYAIVAIRDGGLATSSVTARRWRRGGDVLHHILDPRTGMPAQIVWRTVSVAAGTCADANAASTAAIIRGRQAPSWLAGHRLAARLVDTRGLVVTVAGWPAPEEPEAPEQPEAPEEPS